MSFAYKDKISNCKPYLHYKISLLTNPTIIASVSSEFMISFKVAIIWATFLNMVSLTIICLSILAI